jgi:hypothetical protein
LDILPDISRYLSSRIAPVTMHGWGQTPLSVRVYPVPEVGWNIDVWILSTGK